MALYAGLMSGTSMDGIDVAIVDFPGHKLVGATTVNYSQGLTERIRLLMDKQEAPLPYVLQTHTLIGREFAQAVMNLLHQCHLKPENITAIGSHGQTICHNALDDIPYTMQLGCAHTIAAMTGIKTVADFRTRDIVNGGHGAPFAPLYHRELFAKADADTAVINLGGIANISLLKTGEPTRGYDLGPANCLMDAWITLHQGVAYDKSGAWGDSGTLIPGLLHAMLQDPFFQTKPPKSIGKEYFSLSWLANFLTGNEAPEDVMKTLQALTAQTITHAVSSEQTIHRIVICGGGAHNLALIRQLQLLLPTVSIEIPECADHLEAMLFAWLAYLAVHEQSVQLKSITGSQIREILGVVYPCNP